MKGALDMEVHGTHRLKRERRFLLNEFPPGLERNAPHLQITDNYLTNTRLRLRKIRVPETRERRWLLTQVLHPIEGDQAQSVKVDMWLSPAEYEVLSIFEGNEVRKNRFKYEHEGQAFTVDLYLGALWGLLIAHTSIEGDAAVDQTSLPVFAVADITNKPMFTGPNLAELTIEEVRRMNKKSVKLNGDTA
jgi:CYTH domain-containing protein